MTHTYNHFKQVLGSAGANFATDEFRIVPLQVAANTTADTERDVTTVGGFTTVGEHTDASYTSGGLALGSPVWAKDAANNRSEFSSASVTFSSIDGNDIGAILLIKWEGSLAASIPVAYIDTVSSGPAFPLTPNGGDIVFNTPAEGWLQLT